MGVAFKKARRTPNVRNGRARNRFPPPAALASLRGRLRPPRHKTKNLRPGMGQRETPRHERRPPAP